jgi:hypothetical protein
MLPRPRARDNIATTSIITTMATQQQPLMRTMPMR